jgi:hypothetical protein
VKLTGFIKGIVYPFEYKLLFDIVALLVSPKYELYIIFYVVLCKTYLFYEDVTFN